MKQWINKLVNQFDMDWGTNASSDPSKQNIDISEERATMIYVIDTFNKYLIEIESQPIRKVRESLDDFAAELINPNQKNLERVLFRIRQFFSSYRMEEYTYIQKTFDDFRGIIWDFVDQLAEDLCQEQVEDKEIQGSLDQLKDAVEANSIDTLKNQSRQFIDSYMEWQSQRESRRNVRFENVRKNLQLVKSKLTEANQNMRMDHLTNAYNRKSFDEQLNQQRQISRISNIKSTLILLDIDHFKKVNDTFGHAIGDFVLIELVKVLKSEFNGPQDFVARIGGEEFAILLPEQKLESATALAGKALQTIRDMVLVQNDIEIRFTCSMGLAEHISGEPSAQWQKRADDALYSSKSSGRNKYTLAKRELSAA